MSDIMKLKEATGAGVLDCKKALDETKGDYDKAVALLREKGKAKALKKGSSDRIAAEGVVGSYIHMGGKSVSWLKLTAKLILLKRVINLTN